MIRQAAVERSLTRGILAVAGLNHIAHDALVDAVGRDPGACHRFAYNQGSELRGNAHCALLFPWHPLERQVRVDGIATELPRADVDAYFAQRPRNARLGAHASHQSREVASRAELDTAWAAADASYPDEVPVPEEWGGFRVAPESVEFWQGRPGRMHDRLVYRRTADGAGPASGWTTHRLAP